MEGGPAPKEKLPQLSASGLGALEEGLLSS